MGYSLVFRLYIYLCICIYILLHTLYFSLDDSIYLSKHDGPAFGCAILVVVGVIAVVVVVGAAVVILPGLCCCLATNPGQNGGGGAGLEPASAGSGESDFLKICCCCSQRNTSSVGDNSISASMNMRYPFLINTQKKDRIIVLSRFIYISMVYTR